MIKKIMFLKIYVSCNVERRKKINNPVSEIQSKFVQKMDHKKIGFWNFIFLYSQRFLMGRVFLNLTSIFIYAKKGFQKNWNIPTQLDWTDQYKK